MLSVGGEQYEVVSRPNLSMPKGGPKDPASVRPSLVLPGTPRDYSMHLEFSISGGYSTFGGTPYDIQHLIFKVDAPPPIGFTDDLREFNRLHPGWAIAVKATLNSWKYFSNEFGYAYNKAALTITTVSTIPDFNVSPYTTTARSGSSLTTFWRMRGPTASAFDHTRRSVRFSS